VRVTTRFFHRDDRMKLRSDIVAFVFLLVPLTAFSQEGTWTVSLSGGVVAPSLTTVNEILDKTIRDWNEIQLIPIGPFDHFSTAPAFGLRGEYRYDRDMAVTVSALYSGQKVHSAFRDSADRVNLDRSVQTVEAMVGLSYYLPPLVFDMEVSVAVDVGLVFARADAVSFYSRLEKVGADNVDVVYFDSEAVYTKTKLIANAGLVWTWKVFDPVFVKAEAQYRFRNVGKMNGEIRRLQGTVQEETITDFDFSGFSAMVGIGITF